MNKITFVNNTSPLLSAENLNAIQDNTEDAINDLNDSLTNAIDGLADKIIEETGSNANGNWIKYGDGTMIITQVYSTTVTTSQWSAWGSCYAADLSTPPAFPIAFISQPAVIKSAGNSGNNGWVYNQGDDSATSSGKLGVVRPSQAGTNIIWKVSVIAIGKWK